VQRRSASQAAAGLVGDTRDDGGANSAPGREATVVAEEILARRWDEGRKAGQKGLGGEEDLGATGSIGATKAVANQAAVGALDAVAGDRWAKDVAAKPLETQAIVLVDKDIGVQGVALEEGAARLGPGSAWGREDAPGRRLERHDGC